MSDQPETKLEEFSRSMISALLHIAKGLPPQEFKGYFMGAIVANVIGNLPDDYWREFCKVEPCGISTCNCHLVAAQVLPALEAIRADHIEHTARSLME